LTGACRRLARFRFEGVRFRGSLPARSALEGCCRAESDGAGVTDQNCRDARATKLSEASPLGLRRLNPFQTRNRGSMEERIYDLIFICRPATPEEEITKVVATLEQAANERGGKVEKVEKWGTRKLAYRVSKHREGIYVYLLLRSTQGEMIKELERRLKVSDPVLKYQTVRLDEELKRQQKFIRRRERKMARRPRKPASAGEQVAAAG